MKSHYGSLDHRRGKDEWRRRGWGMVTSSSILVWVSNKKKKRGGKISRDDSRDVTSQLHMMAFGMG